MGPREVQTWVGEPRSHRVSLVTAGNTRAQALFLTRLYSLPVVWGNPRRGTGDAARLGN